MEAAELYPRESIPGRVVDERYHIDEMLAEGGMGCVYSAYDAECESYVALKVLQARAAGQEATRRRFLNEARSTMGIDDPHVVEIRALGELDDGSAYYVMEYLEGATLDEWRVDTFEDLTAIALQICAGLDAAHRRGIVHRDLKPENIIVLESEDGSPHCKLIDFGIAKLPFATMMTVPGQVLGTPAYIAPEQVRSGSTVDARSDIYALGIVLYELISTQLPFEDDDPIQVALAHLGKAPPHIAELEPSCPPRLAALVMRCLEKDPDKRYPDVRSLADELEALNVRGAIGAPPSSSYGASATSRLSQMVDEEHRATLAYPGPTVPRDAPTLARRTLRITPPGPQPWLPDPDSGAITASPPHTVDWPLWLSVAAAAALAAAAAAAVASVL